MRKISVLLFFLFTLVALLISPKAYASGFTTSYLRLNNPQANSAPSGTVCAQASSSGAGIENSVAVTFPTDFTVSTNTSNWTTDTSNLPSGATAWPGISTNASAVSGKTVTFGSTDLTADVLYCFNFTASSSTTGAAGNDKTGTITTKNNSGITIDSTTYAVSIVSNNQISVTASVDPQVADLPITLSSITTGTQFSENTTLSYKITYGTNTVSTVPLTIQAQWSQGTIDGSPVASVGILDYVIGSATNAYNSTPAVIDSVNRTITWTISSIPGQTSNQTVNFSLKTNNSYTGGNKVSFTISARAISGSTVTTDKTVTQNYLYSSASSGTSSTATSTPTPTTSPTTTPIPYLLSFLDISINALSQSKAEISVTTNNNTSIVLEYGTSPKALDKTITSSSYQKQTTLTLSSLYPKTDYYYKVVATDINKNVVTSDIFILTTAIISNVPEVNLPSLVIASNNIILSHQDNQATITQPGKNIIIIPQSNVFEIQFSVSTLTKIKNIQLIVRNKNVLGANTFNEAPDTNASSNFVDLTETQPGIYRGRLLGNHSPGNYELYAKITDFNGNIVVQKISDLKIVNNFKVLGKGSKKPIEHARVIFYLYSPTTKTYNLISPAILPIDNPSFSQQNGVVNVILPEGSYKVNVSAVNHHSNTVLFNIGGDNSDYPTVYLESEPLNIINASEYLSSILTDSLSLHAQFLRYLASSNRFFSLLTTIGWIAFIFLAYLSFSARTHVSIISIPYFFLHKLKLILPWTKQSIAVIRIIDTESKKTISKALVSIIDFQNNQVLLHSKTDKRGEFYFRKSLANEFKISVIKKGFLTNDGIIIKQLEMNKMPLILTLERDKNYKKPLIGWIFLYIEGLIGIFLEFILITSLLGEAFFIFSFGFIKIAPFLFISSLNIILLFLYIYKPQNFEPN